MEICLFDWHDLGHHAHVLRRVAHALAPDATVVLAAPDRVLEELSGLPVEPHPLGGPRPHPAVGQEDRPEFASEVLAREELELFRAACEARRPDHAFHLFTDPVLRWMAREPPYPTPVTIALFHPRAHYPREFATPLSAQERLRAAYYEYKVRRWRRRPDAHLVFTLDPVAARLWNARRGAPAAYFPEPPIPVPSGLPAAGERDGCVLFGALNRRKGADLLADAVALEPTDLRVVVAGTCLPGYEPELERCAEVMRSAGARVELRVGSLPDLGEALTVMGSARCSVLPYREHLGNSGVLTESAALGLPVVALEHGLLGHLVRTHGLGVTVDPTDARRLRSAVLELCQDTEAPARFAPALRRYAETVSGQPFTDALRRAFGLGPGPA